MAPAAALPPARLDLPRTLLWSALAAAPTRALAAVALAARACMAPSTAPCRCETILLLLWLCIAVYLLLSVHCILHIALLWKRAVTVCWHLQDADDEPC